MSEMDLSDQPPSGRAVPVPGDVVQLGPAAGNPAFAYSFLTVTEVRPWGVQGYVQGLGTREGEPGSGGLAYYRAKWEEFEGPIGQAVWWAP